MYCVSELCYVCMGSEKQMCRLSDVDSSNITYKSKLLSVLPQLNKETIDQFGHICLRCSQLLDTVYTFHERCLKNMLAFERYLLLLHSSTNVKTRLTVVLNDIRNNPKFLRSLEDTSYVHIGVDNENIEHTRDNDEEQKQSEYPGHEIYLNIVKQEPLLDELKYEYSCREEELARNNDEPQRQLEHTGHEGYLDIVKHEPLLDELKYEYSSREKDYRQQIDIFALNELTSESTKELIPLLGPRLRFLRKMKENFCTNIQNEQANTFDETCHADDKSKETDVMTSLNDKANNAQQTQFTSQFQMEEEHFLINNEELVENEKNGMKRKKSFLSTESEYRKRRKGHTEGYLKNLLTNHNYFDALKKEYERNSFLSEKSSILLCRIICDDLITSSESRLTNADFSDITDEIISIFPEEKHLTYFIPPILKRNSTTSKSIRARGRLVDMFHNKLRTFRRMCGESKLLKQKSIAHQDIIMSDDIKCSLEWLHHSQDNHDFDSIIKHWRKTAKIRHQILLKSDGVITNYLKKYPLLSDAKFGPLLIDIDFEENYPTASIDFFKKWQKTFEMLLIVAAGKKPSKMIEDLKENLLSDDINQHSKEFLQILLLPLLIPPRGALQKVQRITWKPTAIESQQGIAVYVEPGKIEDAHRKKYELMIEKKLAVQPYIIGVGPKKTNVTDFYVVVDKVRFRFESPLKALSTCFKIFFTWRTEYPPESQQAWLFIQRALFGLETEYDKEKTQVTHLLRAIKKYERPQRAPDQSIV